MSPRPAHAPNFATLLLIAAVSTLTLNSFVPLLPDIADDLGTSYAVASLSIGLYLGLTAIVQLVGGPLSDYLGRRPVLLTVLGLFSVASLGCVLSAGITMFLGFRMLQAVIVSAFVIVLAIVRDTHAERNTAKLIGYLSMAMAVSPMIGPAIGGAVGAAFGWRSIFAAYFALGVALLALCWRGVRETNHSREATIAAQFAEYPKLLNSPRFWGYAMCMAFSTGAFYAFVAGAPLIAGRLFELKTETLGIGLGTITAGFFFGNLIATRLADRIDLTATMIAGRLIACAGPLAGIGLEAFGALNATAFFGAAVLVGFGNGLTMPGANAGAISVLPALVGSAAGLSGAMIVGGGAIVTTLTGTLMSYAGSAVPLLAIMFAASFASLLAVLFVRRVEPARTKEPRRSS